MDYTLFPWKSFLLTSFTDHSTVVRLVGPWRDYTVRGQSNVWRLPKYWPPPPHRPASVYPPTFGAGGGHTRWMERGWGVTALYSIYVSTLWVGPWKQNQLGLRLGSGERGGLCYSIWLLISKDKSMLERLHLIQTSLIISNGNCCYMENNNWALSFFYSYICIPLLSPPPPSEGNRLRRGKPEGRKKAREMEQTQICPTWMETTPIFIYYYI